MTDPVNPTPITALPPAPLVTDTPEQFDDKAFPFAAALDGMRDGMNSASSAAYQNAVAADERAQVAEGAANTATTQADAAMGYRNTAQDAAGVASSNAVAAESARDQAVPAAAAALLAAQRAEDAAAGIQDGPVTSVGGATGVVSLKTINGLSIVGDGNIETTPDAVRRPINTSPAQSATDIRETPVLAGSAYLSLYGVAMAASQWQVSTVADFATTVVSTGDIAGTATTYAVPAGVLIVSTAYYWRVRYKDAEGVYSAWSAPTSFTTAADFNDYIATPAPTPANFGDPFEGGFYKGMLWNQLVQSATSTAIGTGAKTFTVPSMAGAPIVYAGQQLEVRSRANPANKMIGVVTGAVGTTLTLNITSVGGSGTFADWSIMSRYRMIAAPKASGEHPSIALKNADTAFPAACQTLTEGWAATLSMVAAGDATMYPAAHWARSLVIGGKNDWFLDARDGLELDWRNLKPTTTANAVTANRPTGASFNYANNGSYGDVAATHGTNNNSAPPGAAYTADVPGQTAAAAFRTGGAEAYEFGSAYYWSCSEYAASSAWFQYWTSSNPGFQGNSIAKTNAYRVRAVRRSII